MKKFIKRIAVALMALLVAATFVGCSGNPSSTPGTGSSDPGPAKEEKVLDVILLAGQSNALGLSNWSDTAVYYDNVLFFGYYGEGGTMTNRDQSDIDGQIAECRWEKVQNGLGQTQSRFGPEIGIADVCEKRHTNTDHDIAIVKCAWGGMSINSFFLSPTSVKNQVGDVSSAKTYSDDEDSIKCGKGYWAMIKTFRAAEKKALEGKYTKVNYIGMCWMQGEADACNSTAAFKYHLLLSNLMNDLRTYLSVPDLPFAIGEITPPESAAYSATVVEKQKYVCNNDPNAMFVPSNDLTMKPDDSWHYDTASMKTLGTRFGTAIFDLIENA